MRAENCDRYGAEVLGERLTYSSILRRFVCDACGGGVTHTFVGGDKVACARCGSTELISQSQYDRQRSEAIEYKYHQQKEQRKMPLKDVQDTGRLTVLGRIRLGWTEPNASGRGDHAVQSDHFVFKDAWALKELFGEDCTMLKIKFPFADFDKNIAASYRVWAGGRTRGSGICLCEGDGDRVISALPFTVTEGNNGASVKRAPGDRRVSWGKAATDFQWGNAEFHEGDVVPCPGKERNLYPHCEVCKPNILLNIEVQHPDLNVFGYWQVGTGSLNNYRHFLSVWDKLTKQPDGTRIPIPMNDVPFELSIRPGTTLFQNQQDKTWGTTEKFYLHLQLDPDVVKLLNDYRAQRFVALLQGGPIVDVPRLEATQDHDSGVEEYLPFDDPPIEEAEFEPVEEIPVPQPPVEPPAGLTHKTLAREAVSLGYANVGEVKVAMLALYGPQWERTTEWSPSEAWYQLRDHVRAGAA